MLRELAQLVAPEYILKTKFETPEQDPIAYAFTAWALEIAKYVAPMEIYGTFPQEGSAFIYGNHNTSLDPFLMYLAAVKTANRTIRVWAKDSLVRDVNETDTAQLRRSVYRKDRAKRPSALERWFVNHFHVIPARIGGGSESLRELINRTNGELRVGRLVGGFINGTCSPDHDLLDSMHGSAMIAMENSDTPLIPVGFSNARGGSYIVHIGEPYTFNQIRTLLSAGPDRVVRHALTLEMARRIAPLIKNVDQKLAWELFDKFGFGEREIRKLHPANLRIIYDLMTEEELTREEVREFMGQDSLSPYIKEEKTA